MVGNYDADIGLQLKTSTDPGTEALQRTIDIVGRLNRSVTAMTKKIERMTQVFERLKSVDLSAIHAASQRMAEFVNALSNVSIEGSIKQLRKIPKIMESIAAIDASKVGEVFTTLATQIQPFLATLKEAESSLIAFEAAMHQLNKKSSLKNVEKSISNVNKEAKKSPSLLKRMFNIGKIYWFLNYTKQLGQSFANIVNNAIDYVETENYFSRAMGEAYEQANRFQNKIAEAYGLATTETMKYQATFMNMMNSIGNVGTKTAEKLSETLSLMAVDYASLYNTSIESAMTKFQAALTKQVRPIRSTSGYDITQATLQESLQQLGIYDRSVRTLSQIEQRLLIIYTLQQQMANSSAMGDYARTIENAANQLRVLQQQFKELTKWVGGIFYQALEKVLPYINAVVMVLKELAKMVAIFFGYNPKTSGGTGVGNILDGYGDSAEDATAKVEDLEKAVDNMNAMGIDELNTFAQDTGGSSADLGGMGIDDRILAGLTAYDGLMDDIQMKAEKIRDAIMDWLGFDKIINEDGSLSWILRDGPTNIGRIITGLKVAGAIIAGWILSTPLRRFIELFSGDNKFFKGLFNIGDMFKKVDGPGIDWGKIFHFDALKKSLSGIFSNLGSLVKNSKIGKAAGSAGKGLMDGLLNSKAVTLLTSKLAGLKAAFSGISTTVGLISAEFAKLFAPFIQFMQPFVQFISAFVTSPAFIAAFFAALIGGFIYLYNTSQNFRNFVGQIIDTIVEKFNIFVTTIQALGTQLWEQVISPIIDLIQEKLSWLWENGFKDLVINLTAFIGLVVTSLFDLWNNVLAPLISWLIELLAPTVIGVVDTILGVVESIVKTVTGVVDSVITILKGIIKFITGIFTADWKMAWSGLGDIFTGIMNIIITVFEGLLNMIIDGINGFLNFINGLIIGASKLHSSLSWLANCTLPTLGHIVLDRVGPKSVSAGSTGADSMYGYAEGGFPDRADIFFANENGVPELVGRIGSQTTVANQEQIIEGIKRGVMEAMAAVDSGGDINLNQTIELDGEPIYRNQQKIKKNRGYNFGLEGID